MKHLQFILISLFLTCGIATADTVEVRIEKMQFIPADIKIKAGDTIKWKSYEKRGYHTVWFKRENLPESPPLFLDDSTQRTFDKPGTYPYECGPHPQMVGTVIVE